MTRSQIRRITTAALVALVALSGTTALGFWQYSRAHRDDISAQVLAMPAVPVQELVAAKSYVSEAAFARRVSVDSGTVSTTGALLSCQRIENAEQGCWVIAPVYIQPGLASVALLGFVPNGAARTALERVRSANQVHGNWSGRLQPTEVTDRGQAVLRPSDTITSINVNELAIRWHTSLLDGYIVLSPPLAIEGLQALTSPLNLPPSGITWRNLFYAWQWWAFALFVVFLLGRYAIDVRNEAPTLSPDARTTREDQP